MFQGIIKEMGTVTSIERTPIFRLGIHSPQTARLSTIGDSIAVNGCCLTVIALSPNSEGTWWAEVMEETLRKTSLDSLKIGENLNIEHPICYGDAIGGHLIQGHIDEVGYIEAKEEKEDHSWDLTVRASSDFLRLLTSKGSIAVDGVSLTVTTVHDTYFRFSMIPHTKNHTSLGIKLPGAPVHLEADILAKQVVRWLSTDKGS